MHEGMAAAFESPTREIRELVTEPKFSRPWRPAPEPPVDLDILQRMLDGLRRLWINDVSTAMSAAVDSASSISSIALVPRLDRECKLLVGNYVRADRSIDDAVLYARPALG